MISNFFKAVKAKTAFSSVVTFLLNFSSKYGLSQPAAPGAKAQRPPVYQVQRNSLFTKNIDSAKDSIKKILFSFLRFAIFGRKHVQTKVMYRCKN